MLSKKPQASKPTRKTPTRSKRALSTAARRVVSADTTLSPQQRRFVEEVAAGGFTNETKAYEAVYATCGAAAVSGASRLLAQANVTAAGCKAMRDKLSAHSSRSPPSASSRNGWPWAFTTPPIWS